ncbi:MAG: FecR family protein [Bacteroidales bacterium]
MSIDRMQILFQRHIEQTITRDEESELLILMDKASDDEIKSIILKYYDKLPVTNNLTIKDKARIFRIISQKSNIKSGLFKAGSTRFLSRVGAIAAVALILITTTLVIFRYEKKKPAVEINQIVRIEKPIEKPLYKNDIRPGGNKAILTLADGSKVVLDDAKEGLLKELGNTTIIKLDSGRVAYNIRPATSSIEKVVQYNTLTTPRGGKYCITLPDGTVVWLNASTTLRFPTEFNGKTRKVEVKGEAYFEVSKNENMPFIVLAGNSEIKVLGTQFNVMAYTDEKLVKTTLLEGSVELKPLSKQGGDEAVPVILIPGQQALVDESNTLSVKEVDTQEAIAWKNGLFIFKNERLESVMQKIARWYDVEVIYENSNDPIQFTANISRSENMSEVLRMLELTETVHFKIEKKTITVLQ